VILPGGVKALARALRGQGPRNRIFLLSHMRAHTSVLGHILGSNPAIEGYYEMQRRYTRRVDLRLQQLFFYARHEPKPGAAYLFDKILHDKYRLDDALLGADDRLVIMIRKPGPTISSIARLFGDKPGHKFSTFAGAEAYYAGRLASLQRYSERLEGRFLLLEAEDLVERPAAALERLTGFLSLRVPLSEQYDVFPNTGVPGTGDTSALIRSGHIATRAPGSPEFTPGETLAGLYDAALQELTRRSVEPARTPSARIGDAGADRPR
jgi:hypothetical protein